MRRPRKAKSTIGVSLFPFLAVLICTMGALIVLLVLVVQQARVHADTISEDRKKQDDDARRQRQLLEQEREDHEWRQQIIEQQRVELATQLADKRLELSHLEDHIRRLEQKWRQLRSEIEQMQSQSGGSSAQLAEAKYELIRLQAAIETERQRLDEARKEAAKRQRSYSIIPYPGPNGTQRRPIYIECRESGIILQPEGVVLTPADFNGPLGPGNPLDATLRAIREYWVRVEGGPSKGEPYPLLIVRPDGAVAYSMARAAIASWDDEFGYELVEDDLELNFPESDERLKKILENAVAIARQRQAILAAAMPSRFPQGSRQGFVASGGQGGFSAEFNSGDEGEGYGGGPRGSSGAGTGSASNNGFSNRPGSQVAGRSGDNRRGGNSRPSGGFDQAARGGASGLDGDNFQQGFYGSGGANSGPGGQAAAPGGGSGQNQPGSPNSQAGAPANVQSLANTKGRNWGLPNIAGGATAITRPISVECHKDRLVILPDRGKTGAPRVITFRDSVSESVEQFVSEIWSHMESWGLAVSGGYWKPIAKIKVTPGAEPKFRELEILLEDSGIEIERK